MAEPNVTRKLNRWGIGHSPLTAVATVLFLIGCGLTIASVEIMGLVFLLAGVALGIYDAFKTPRTWRGERK